MRRLLSIIAAVAVVAAPLATAGLATAKDHHDERRGPAGGRGGDMRGGEMRGGPPHQGPPPGAYRGGEPEYRGGGRSERVDPRSDPRYDPRNGYRGETRVDPRYDPRYDPRVDPRSYGPPPGAYQAAPRRGGYLEQGGPVIEDYGRYRLRPPPRGYDWVRTPGGMALVSRENGRVYDVVPY